MNLKRWMILSLALALAGAVLAGRSASVLAADWPQLQADAERSGYSPDAVRAPFTLKWAWFGEATRYPGQPAPARATVRLGGMVQPVVVGDLVFVGAMDGALYAIDRQKGVTVWTFKTGRPIIQPAAYADGILVVNSMDGNVYGVDTAGKKVWTYETPYGIFSAPAISGGVAYVTCRDGKAVALEVKTGKRIWEADVHSPIVNSPAVHDGVMVFGSEDMMAHGVDAATGHVLWSTPVGGQSFRSTWPVAYKDMVIFHVMPAISGTESGLLWDPNIEAVLKACPPNNWPAEKAALLKYLTDNPQRQTVFVLDLKTGTRKYTPPIGATAGNMQPPMPAVYDPQGHIYIYWRTRSSRLQALGTYGTEFRPDIDMMDPATGDRVMLPFGPVKYTHLAVELDNNFLLTLGGDVLYGANHFRVNLLMDLKTGEFSGISKAFNDERDGGYPVPQGTFWHYENPDHRVPAPGSGTNGDAGVVPLGDCVYVNETNASCVACYQGQGSSPATQPAQTAAAKE